MIFGIEIWVVVVLAVAILVGSTVQGLVGLGIGLVGAPIATILAPELMPGLLLWLALILPLGSLLRHHEEIDWRGLAWAMPARVPGTVLGVIVVANVTERQFGVVIGLVVLAAVLTTWRAVAVPIRPATLLGAGFISGITGTATSIGGPPMAILYQRRSPTQIRNTLAVYFIVGATLSLTGLGLTGELHIRELIFAAMMVPLLFIGLAVARRLARRVSPNRIRGAILVVCALSGASLLVRSLLPG
ncbi:MAG: sulfite exporter TauE/SafE family protein [Propionibacteriaceae bacterium]